MPIKNYATEVSVTPNRIDLATFQGEIKMLQGSVNLASAALNESVSRTALGWKVMEVGLIFNAATSRAFSISKHRGVRIITGRNDRLWVGLSTAGIEAITLTAGFYSTGAALATEIQTQLNNNTVLAASETFIVAYSSLYRNFTITTASATPNVKVFIEATTQPVRRNSTAAPSLGFTSDTAWNTAIGGQSKVIIGKEIDYAYETASTVLNTAYTDEFQMDIDSSLVLEAASGPAVIVDWYVLYQDLVPLL